MKRINQICEALIGICPNMQAPSILGYRCKLDQIQIHVASTNEILHKKCPYKNIHKQINIARQLIKI